MATLQSVFDDIRALLQGGSTSPARGLGNGVLQGSFNQAYTEMWQTLEQVQVPRVRREFYFIVPAYTTYVDPVTAGVLDMGEPEMMFERGNLLSVQIATTSTDSPIAVSTVTPHNLTTNAAVTVGQVSNTRSPWGRFFVTVLDANTFTLNGSVSDNVVGIGGVVATSTERGIPVRFIDILDDAGNYWTPQQRLGCCMFENGVFNFRGATAAAQIRVIYFANSTAPSDPNTDIAIPSANTFLATRAAGILAQSRGLTQMADVLEARALGPGRQADGRGGQLRGFLNIQVNGLARNTYRNLAYSPTGVWSLWPSGTAFGGGPASGGDTWDTI